MRSLFSRRPTRARVTEATPEQIAISGAAAGSWGVDPVDGTRGWTPIGSHTREIPQFTLEKARANSVAAYRMNPLGRAIIDTYVSFCVGDVGVSYICTNDDVREIVKDFWEDPANDLDGVQEMLLRDLLIMGEVILELGQGAVSGVVRYRPVIVGSVQRVSLLNQNPMTPDKLYFMADGENTPPPLEVVRINDETGLREGNAMYWRPWRTLTSDVHSVPFLTPVLDWLDNYDTVLSNLIDRTSLARYLVWDVTVQGGQEAVDNFIASRGGTNIPRSGTVEVHNESVQWEPKTVSTGAQEDSIANSSVMTLVAGGTGLSKTWLAEPEGSNRATSHSMAEPVRRRVQGVQKMWLSCLRELLRYVVDQAVAAGRLPATVTSMDPKTGQELKVPTSQSVDVMGPEVAAADTQITAQVLLNLSTGLQNLVNTGVMTREAAHIAAKKAWEDYVGTTYTQDLDDPTKGLNAQPTPAPQPVAGAPGANGQNPPGTDTGGTRNDGPGKPPPAAGGVAPKVPREADELINAERVWDLICDLDEIRESLEESGERDLLVEAAWAAVERDDAELVLSVWEGDFNPELHPRDEKGKFSKHGVDLSKIKVGDKIVGKHGGHQTVTKITADKKGVTYFKTREDEAGPLWVSGNTVKAHHGVGAPTPTPTPAPAAVPPPVPKPLAASPGASGVNKHGVDLAGIKVGDTIHDSKGNPHVVTAIHAKKNTFFKTKDGKPVWVSAGAVTAHHDQHDGGSGGSPKVKVITSSTGAKHVEVDGKPVGFVAEENNPQGKYAAVNNVTGEVTYHGTSQGAVQALADSPGNAGVKQPKAPKAGPPKKSSTVTPGQPTNFDTSGIKLAAGTKLNAISKDKVKVTVQGVDAGTIQAMAIKADGAPSGYMWSSHGHISGTVTLAEAISKVEDAHAAHLGVKAPSISMGDQVSSTGKPILTGHDAFAHVPKSTEFISPLSPEAEAIKRYTGSKYLSINSGLRGDSNYRTPEIEALDRAFDLAPPTTQELLVRRGVHGGEDIFGPIGSRVGKTFKDNAYVSTAHGAAFSGDTRIHIEIPPGAKVLRPDGNGVFGDNEGEIILPRGSEFEVISDGLSPDGTKRWITLRLKVSGE